MDDYLSKPLRKKELLSTITKWIPSRPVAGHDLEAVRGESANMGADRPMNFEGVLEEFAGDEQFLRKLLNGFLDNVRAQLETIREGLSRGDSEVIRQEAHTIKGGAANLTADELAGVAFELENLGKAGDLKEGSEIIGRLEKEFRRLEAYAEKR